jgi:hypothetical protein
VLVADEKGMIMLTEKNGGIEAIAAIGPGAHPPASKYERLIARAKQVLAASTIVAHPCDETSLRGPIEAVEAGIIIPILVGPAAKISAVAHEHKLDISRSRSSMCLAATRPPPWRSGFHAGNRPAMVI